MAFTTPHDEQPPNPADPADSDGGRGNFRTRGGLRRLAARGTLVNGAFTVGVNGLSVVRGFAVAAFVGAAEYGVWGILVITLGTIFWMKEVGISDRYIQQEDLDQETAFQKAFTLEFLFNLVFFGILVVAVPLFALLYGRSELVAPGFVLALAVPAVAFQTPIWIFYRRMNFGKQRLLQSVDPVVGFVVAVGLAAAGMGYWALVIATVAGAWAAALVAMAASPYRLKLRYERGTAKDYLTFSWPIFVASGSGVLVAQVPIYAASEHLGLAAVGAITLASSIALYTQRVDQIITDTIYPAICAVRDRADLLQESFVKSNRLGLLWGVPFGAAMTLFAEDFVEYVIGGERWRLAVPVLQAFGLIAVLQQIAFNWVAFYKALANTKPLAVASVAVMLATIGLTVPLIAAEGLDGFAIGMFAATLVGVLVRMYYVARLFPPLPVIAGLSRSFAPGMAAALAVLALRAVEGGGRSLGLVLAEGAAFLAVTVLATVLFERGLLRELRAYLGRPATATA